MSESPVPEEAISGPADDAAGPPFDLTMVAVGTSVMWGTGNAYENKFADLVHRDLNGGYPLAEKYLHFNPGPNQEPSSPRYPYDEPPNTDIVYPNGSYYGKTLDDGYGSGTHPKGPHLPPSRLRARGGAIIGLSWPAKIAVGGTKTNPSCDKLQYNDHGFYLYGGAKGDYDGKLDGLRKYASLDSKYANLFSKSDIDRSKWLLMRDIGWGWPTIVDQIQQFDPGGQGFSSPVDVPVSDQPAPFDYTLPKRAPKGEDVDVVLVDGGTNDMQLGWLNNPRKSERPDIKEAAKLYFYDNMTGENMPGEKGLLRRARDTFPNAVIVVLGYPVWTSNRTDIKRAKQFLTANDWLGSFAAEQALDNPLNFSHFQAHYLRKAVAEVAREDDGPGMVFAPPGYGVVNAMMADWPWSFGVKPNEDPLINVTQMISVDDVQAQREAVCEAELEWEKQKLNAENNACQDEVGTNVACTAAGVGHPNNEGSRQYADTIVRRFKEYVDLSVGDNADEYDGGTDSLRKSLERYGIGPDGKRLQQELSGSEVGTRFGLSQRVVDSIKVEVETRKSSEEADDVMTGQVWLGARPGRRGEAGKGDREKFVLDTESEDFVDRDEFYVDPMMRRRLSGPVGNVDEDEDALVKGARTEPNDQSVHSTGHWSDRRLRLGMVDHLTLVVEDVKESGWAAQKVSYQLNGSFGGTRNLKRDFDHADFRDTVRPREFQVASFNDVEGVSASDLKIRRIGTNFDGSGTAKYEFSVGVENPTGERVPSVLVQYGWEVDGAGRDWQVVDLGGIPSGGSRSATVELRAEQDIAFRTKTITVRTGAFVGDTVQWTATKTDRGELDDL